MPAMRTIRGLEAALDEVRYRSQELLNPDTEATVRELIDAVRRGGDAALRSATERLDGVRLDALEVSADDVAAAADELDPDLRGAIALSAERIEAYYRHQPSEGFLHAEDGAVLGQLVRPIERVGVYVPGGTAPLVSSLLMSAVPARVAGVPRIVVATPPRSDGTVAPEIRYAAALVGAETVLRVGGAQAVAALAYGTESVLKVDKIVGPGNAYVVAAKRLVYGTVGVESLPGPTETLVVADETADPEHVAADLLAQAEHLGAQPVLVAWTEAVATAAEEALERALAALPNPESARASVRERGLTLLVDGPEQAMEVANAYAPEHLCLLVRDPWSYLPSVRNAGGVFVGPHSMEALGDYVAGPSHVMPTGATARFASFVNLRDFQKVIPVVSLSPGLVDRIGPPAVRMARAEGLEAHARAVLARLDGHDD
jgi:histidinol dehydrogenase